MSRGREKTLRASEPSDAGEGQDLRENRTDEASRVCHGDLFAILPTLAAESVDACVTDGPYGIGFMGREWDTFKPGVEAKRIVVNTQRESTNPNLKGRTRGPASSPSAVEYDYSLKGLRAFQAFSEAWGREVYRVLKPGGYILSCGAPRAYHRMASGLEDAGFEIRDCLAWLFGSGFPKSLNIGDGLGTALKPAHEPIVLARKPFKGSVAANVAQYGTGALNIDACRIPGEVPSVLRWGGSVLSREKQAAEGYRPDGKPYANEEKHLGTFSEPSHLGRWPANVVIDDLAAMVLDEQSGELGGSSEPRIVQRERNKGWCNSSPGPGVVAIDNYGDSGGASRFYYVAKPSREERDMGCYDLPARSGGDATDRKDGSAGLQNPRAGAGRTGGARNIHPTVKPVELMRWLVRLVTPHNGIVLDPFLGSGTTAMACVYEQRRYIGIEREAEYIAIAERRIASVAPLFTQGEDAR